MNIGRDTLYRIILEEYFQEEGILLREMDDSKFEEFLAWIRKEGPKPAWLDTENKADLAPPVVPPKDPNETQPLPKDPNETQPMPTPHSTDMSDDEIVSSISQMIHGKDPEHVSTLFQTVFKQIPGVELSSPGDEDYPEEMPPTEYGGEELELRQRQDREVGFKESWELEDLKSLIKEVIGETEWHDLTRGETAPPHQTDAVQPLELIQRIENAYHELEEAFQELPDEIAQSMGEQIISDLQTLMDVTEYPEDYRE